MAGSSGAVSNPRVPVTSGWVSGHSYLLTGWARSEPTRPLSASERATRLRAVGELVGSLRDVPRAARTAPRKTPKRSTQAQREAEARRILGPRRAAYMLDRGSRP